MCKVVKDVIDAAAVAQGVIKCEGVTLREMQHAQKKIKRSLKIAEQEGFMNVPEVRTAKLIKLSLKRRIELLKEFVRQGRDLPYLTNTA